MKSLGNAKKYFRKFNEGNLPEGLEGLLHSLPWPILPSTPISI